MILEELQDYIGKALLLSVAVSVVATVVLAVYLLIILVLMVPSIG